jgi:Fic family protein
MNEFDRKIPFNNLPLLPPKVELETKKILKKTISASRALARLNGALTNLPNPGLFLDTIHLQEAKSSSAIENIITTNDDLYQSAVAARQPESGVVKEVLSYKEALWLGLEKLETRPFITTNLCIEIVQCIKKNSAGIRKIPGTALSNSLGDIIYTPPTGENVIHEKLSNWERFINEELTLDPLIKMALMHYQFEAIHPFADGNGRTGRILLLLFLKLEKLLDIPAIYLSGYINENKSEYYKKLRNITENSDWEAFILYMLDMVESTSNNGLKRMENIVALMESTSEKLKKELPKVYSKDLVEILFKLPYTKRNFLINAGIGNLKTTGNYLNLLEEKGILKSVRLGKEKLYLNYRLMNILNENE